MNAAFKIILAVFLMAFASGEIKSQTADSTKLLNHSEQKAIVITSDAYASALFIDAEEKEVTVRIFSITGKLVIEKRLQEQFVDISALKRGFYIVQVTSGENTVTRKFLKK